MKKVLVYVFFFVLIAPLGGFAQKPYRLVLHLQTADTLVHKALVAQIGNIKKELPEASIKLICHGPGIVFLLKDSPYMNTLKAKAFENVEPVGCEYSMKQRGLTKADLTATCSTVPYGIVEIVKRESEGWLYIKLGF